MDFGFLGDAVKDQVMDKVDPSGMLKGFVKESGIKLNPADIKDLLSNDAIKNALIGAVKSIVMSKMQGEDIGSAVKKSLMQVAGGIMTKAPDSGMTKDQIADSLQQHIKNNIPV